MPFWVPPACWDIFQTNYAALQKLRTPSQFQGVITALLNAGHTFILDSQEGVTVNDDDVRQWLYSAHNLATRLQNSSMAQSTSACDNEPSGVIADAGRFWQPELDWIGGELTALDNAVTPYANVALWLILGVAAIVLLPPLINAVSGGRR